MDNPAARIMVNAEVPYAVSIGRGVRREVSGHFAGVARVGIVVPELLMPFAHDLFEDADAAGCEVTLITPPIGEAQKTIEWVRKAWDELARAGFTRSDLIVGVGGGATTDLAGFIAASWLRGIRWIAVPTTLVGMVDAAIGGKTGINTDAGKNLVGAFHSPGAVLCDTEFLSSLDEKDLKAGLAEVVKCGFISDPAILEIVEADPVAVCRWDSDALFELIERAVRVKARVVGSDFKEGGLREILNYGHTLGHAIERNENYQWRHGDAVSIGLVYAAALARLAGHLDRQTADRHHLILESLDLPITYPKDAWPELLATMSLDKKTRAKQLRFVILNGLALPTRLEGPDLSLLERAYEEVAE